MTIDKFKAEVAKITAKAFVNLYQYDEINSDKLPALDFEKVYNLLETPKNPEMGQYALPLFQIAGKAGLNPNKLNQSLVKAQKAQLEKRKLSFISFSAAGGFNNARIEPGTLARYTLTEILDKKNKYGSSDFGGGENVVFDYSSPNIAKPFGVGHLRSTAIGNSLYRVYEKLGYNSIGINHLGDWGTQFGKLIVAFRLWGNEKKLRENPIQKLYELYVKYHKEEKTNPVLSEQAREAFKDLEDGDQEAATLWAKFKEYSLVSFNKTYELLGVKFDYFTGESFYNDKIDKAVEKIEKAGLTEISDGALIVNLDKYNLPPCLLRKADGATLYATRDLAGIFYRWKTFNFVKALYVVGSAQRDHFKQVFKVIELLDKVNKTPEEECLAPRLKHVEFGWIKFKDRMMSTREGNIILLNEVLDKAIGLAKEKIKGKNPNLRELDRTARQIGVGAVIYADLSTRKEKDVNFDWDQVLSFEGESGPYLQYTHARLSSLIRNYGREIPQQINYSMLDKPEEAQVIDLLYKFPQVVWSVSELNEPFLISSYLLELASAFNKVYQRKDANGRIDRIISNDIELTEARISLVNAVRIVINEGLYLLGIEAPEEM